MGTTLPCGQRKPVSHSTHAVAPVAFWCEPSAHGVHCLLVSAAAYVPASHGVRSLGPAKQ